MKSPLLLWAHEVLKEMRTHDHEVTPVALASHMIVEDADDVRDFYFGSVLPEDHRQLPRIINRIEVIKYAATQVVVKLTSMVH
jgi:hypothetical protein